MLTRRSRKSGKREEAERERQNKTKQKPKEQDQRGYLTKMAGLYGNKKLREGKPMAWGGLG